MDQIKQAEQYFADGFLCSQAVFAAFAAGKDLTEEQALNIAACFGSGMCKGEVCGAVSGALMVLGLKYGQTRARSNELTNRYLDRFRAEHGSYLCRELLGYDFSKEGEAQRARASGVFSTLCPKLVGSAARILTEILDEERKTEP